MVAATKPANFAPPLIPPGTSPKLSAIALTSDQISLSTGVGGTTYTTLDPYKMQNPAHKAMLIDEVRFIPLGGSATWQTVFGGVVFARLRVNRQNITNDFTPIWVLGGIRNAPAFANLGQAIDRNNQYFVYRPSRPIYVPQYTNLQCDLTLDPVASGISGITAANFQVIYVGRQFDDINDAPGPHDTVDAPWVARWIPPSFASGALTTGVRSTANDLSSPFAQDTKVQKMVGRILTDTDAFWDDPSLPLSLVTITMANISGAIITRDPTPYGMLFDGITREMQLDTTVDRTSYFIATLNADLRNYGDSIAVHTALHGYRTVTFAEYMS